MMELSVEPNVRRNKERLLVPELDHTIAAGTRCQRARLIALS